MGAKKSKKIKTQEQSSLSAAMLKTAKLDLKASCILYDASLFPQSIFSLQQSIEKANKAIAIDTGYFDLKSLKKLGHNQDSLAKAFMKEHIQDVQDVNELLIKGTQDPKSLNFLDILGVDFKDYHKKISNVGADIEWLNKETAAAISDKEKLIHFLDFIEMMYQQVNDPKLYKRIAKYCEKHSKEIFDHLNEIEAFSQDSLDMRDIDFDFVKMLSAVIYKFITAAVPIFALQLLGFIFDSMVSEVRYPSNVDGLYSIPKIYSSKGSPLIKQIPTIQSVLTRAIKDMRKITKD
jgi:hypothetical protein